MDEDELCQDMGMTRPQMQQELDGIRGLWQRVAPRASSPEEPKKPTAVMALKDDAALLEAFSLTQTFADAGERKYFVGRVQDYRKLLEEKTTTGLARNMLMTELHLYRLDGVLMDAAKCKPGSADYRATLNLRKDFDRTYQDQLEQARKLAPWFSAIAGKYAFAGVLSDITKAMQLFYRDGSQELADGIFTATEIEVELRRSVQAPEPRYRAGWVVHANVAKAFLFDPNWRNRFSPATFKKLDQAWAATVVSADAEAGLSLPDLEHEGEFGDLPVPKKEEGTVDLR